jgi:MEDS: MEthanogen/methylotroph, DcmR Sensory domain
MSEHPQDVHLAGVPLERNRHVCAFFHTPDEEYQVMLPFLREGIDQAENAFYIVDPARRTELRRRLEQAGIGTDALQQSGQLEVHPWTDAQLRGGRCDPDSWLAFADETMARHRAQGFPRTRLWSNQEWAVESLPGVEYLVQIECRWNSYIQAKYDNPTVCVYDLNKHPGAIVMDMLRTHPMVIIGGVLYENPYYVPPDEFLRELRQRR